LAFGEIPKGLFVCHRCDACVNPDHLFLGTNRDNLNDASSKLRINGENNSNSKPTASQVIEIRKLWPLGHSQVSLGIRFGVTPEMICAIVHGRSWKHLLSQSEQMTML